MKITMQWWFTSNKGNGLVNLGELKPGESCYYNDFNVWTVLDKNHFVIDKEEVANKVVIFSHNPPGLGWSYAGTLVRRVKLEELIVTEL